MSSFSCPLFCGQPAGEGTPLIVHVVLTPSDEVQALRAQLADVQSKLLALQQDFNRVEFWYRQEVVINTTLLDLCREHGIKYRPSWDGRHEGDGSALLGTGQSPQAQAEEMAGCPET